MKDLTSSSLWHQGLLDVTPANPKFNAEVHHLLPVSVSSGMHPNLHGICRTVREGKIMAYDRILSQILHLVKPL